MWTLTMLVTGMLIGWNLLPQPKWVANLWNKGESKIKEKYEK